MSVRSACGSLVMAAVAASGTALAAHPVVLSLLPVALAFVAIAAGWYPGERVLVAALRRRRGRRRARARTLLVPRPRAALRCPRGGALLAASLAGRAPPPVPS